MPTPAEQPTRRANADVAAYAIRLGDDALILSQRLSEWSAHAPADRRGHRAGQHRARPARPGPLAAVLRRRVQRPVRGRPGLPARGTPVHQPAAGRTGERRLRASPWSGSCCSPATSTSSTASWSPPPTPSWPRSPPRRSRRSPTTSSTPAPGCSGWATAPSSATTGPRPRWTRLALHPRAVRRRRAVSTGSPTAASARCRPALRPAWQATVEAVLAEATLTVPDDGWQAHRRPQRPAHRGLRLPAGRDAAPAPIASGGPW